MNRFALLSLCLALTSAACAQALASTPSTPAAAPPASVRVAEVEMGEAPPVRAVGTLAGKSEVRLSFKNGGTVERLLVEAGAHVHRGQLLAALNQTEITSQVAQAEAAAQKAQLDFDRVERLQREGTVSQAAFDGARTALEVARGSVAIAQYNRKVAEIAAPEDGVIEQRLAEVSELVAPGQPIFTLRAARQGLVLRVGLTDRDLLQTHLGTAARVRFGALPNEVFAGTLSELATSATPRSGTFEAEIKLDTADARLLPGLVASVELTRAAPALSWVPVEALVEQTGLSASVFSLASGSPAQVQKRPVTIAYLEGDRAGIATGLQDVTRVVTDGVASCESGAVVQVTP